MRPRPSPRPAAAVLLAGCLGVAALVAPAAAAPTPDNCPDANTLKITANGPGTSGEKTLSGVTLRTSSGPGAGDPQTFSASDDRGGRKIVFAEAQFSDGRLVRLPNRTVATATVTSSTGAYATRTVVCLEPTAAPGPVLRLAGTDRIATANAVSQDQFPFGLAGAVVLASAENFPDALVAAPLALARRAPVLLSAKGALSEATQREIVRVLPAGQTVYLLGGSGALNPSVETSLRDIGYDTVRFGGLDRYETAKQVADQLPGTPKSIFLADGTGFTAALVAGPAAAVNSGPVLLTDGGGMPRPTADYLAAHPGLPRFAVGSAAQVADPGATKVGDNDPANTARAVGDRFFPGANSAVVATTAAYADSLTGAALATGARGPVLLSDRSTLSTPTREFLGGRDATIVNTYLVGGTGALSDNVQAQIKAISH